VEALSRWERAPFSRVGAYNFATTRKPVIYQFEENCRPISSVIIVLYKNHKKCARIQWPARIARPLTDGGDAQGFDWAFFNRIPLWLSSKYSNIGRRDVSYEKKGWVNSKLKYYLEVKRCQQKDL
jgi:hypothetical protein